MSSVWTEVSQSLAAVFVASIARRMESSVDSSRLAALTAVSSYAASSLSALEIVAGLSKSPEVRILAQAADLLLVSWTELLKSKLEIQAAALKSIARVISSSYDRCIDENDRLRHAECILKLLRRVGDIKGTSTMVYILKLAKQPVEELKFGAFEIFLSLAKLNQGWGMDVLFSHADFPAYLLVCTFTYTLSICLMMSLL